MRKELTDMGRIILLKPAHDSSVFEQPCLVFGRDAPSEPYAARGQKNGREICSLERIEPAKELHGERAEYIVLSMERNVRWPLRPWQCQNMFGGFG